MPVLYKMLFGDKYSVFEKCETTYVTIRLVISDLARNAKIFITLTRSCGKVMFLHPSVILFTGVSLSRGCLCPGGCLSPGGCLCPGGSLSGGLCPWGLCLGVSIQGGTHPTGMLCCFIHMYININISRKLWHAIVHQDIKVLVFFPLNNIKPQPSLIFVFSMLNSSTSESSSSSSAKNSSISSSSPSPKGANA